MFGEMKKMFKDEEALGITGATIGACLGMLCGGVGQIIDIILALFVPTMIPEVFCSWICSGCGAFSQPFVSICANIMGCLGTTGGAIGGGILGLLSECIGIPCAIVCGVPAAICCLPILAGFGSNICILCGGLATSCCGLILPILTVPTLTSICTMIPKACVAIVCPGCLSATVSTIGSAIYGLIAGVL